MRSIQDSDISNIEKYNKSIAILYFIFGLIMAGVSLVDASNQKEIAMCIVGFGCVILVLGNYLVLKKYRNK